MKTRLLLPLFALLPLAACDSSAGEADEGAGVVEPDLDGKMDEFSGVENGGTLRFGETVDGEFDEDFQFFEYTFRARENAEVTIEITQAGSSRDLDTTVFLYRNDPEGGSPSRIAFDDDAGWGALSRIEDFRLFSEDEYTIVVGTKDATGRGRFRLSLGCESGECQPEDQPQACHPFFQEALAECFVEIGGFELEFEVPGHELVAECEGWVSDSTEGICPTEDEPLCVDSTPFLDACMTQWGTEYVRPATGLSEDNDGGLDAFVETVWSSENCSVGEDAGCSVDATLYRYDGDAPAAPSLLAFAREQSEIGPGAFMNQTLEADAESVLRMADTYGATDAFEAFLTDAGLDFAEARVSITESFGEFNWNWGDCEGGMFVVTFPSAQRVLVMQDLFCYG